MNELPRQIHDAEKQIQGEEKFPATERADGQIKIGAGNRIDRENDRPAQFFIVVEHESPGQYGPPDEALGDHNLHNHPPGKDIYPSDVIDIQQANHVRKKIDVSYF